MMEAKLKGFYEEVITMTDGQKNYVDNISHSFFDAGRQAKKVYLTENMMESFVKHRETIHCSFPSSYCLAFFDGGFSNVISFEELIEVRDGAIERMKNEGN